MTLSKKIATEAQEQMALIQWAHTHPICRDYLIAIPNGGSRHPREAANLKRQGVRAGVSDLFLAYPVIGPWPQINAGLWIELKRRSKARVTDEQVTWIDRMNAIGYFAIVAFGWEEAKRMILSYLGETSC
jgi:VRR-NUC domain-containing protein